MRYFKWLSSSVLISSLSLAGVTELNKTFSSATDSKLIYAQVSSLSFEEVARKINQQKKEKGIYSLKSLKKVKFKDLKMKFFKSSDYAPEFCSELWEEKLSNPECFNRLEKIIKKGIKSPQLSYIYINGDNEIYDYKKLYLIVTDKKSKKLKLHLQLTIQDEAENNWLTKVPTFKTSNDQKYLSHLKSFTQNNLVEFVGYSGLGYKDLSALEDTYKYFANLNSGKKVLMFGATIDGIGHGYSFYENQFNQNFHLTGMVSVNAEKYDIIEAANQSVFVVNSYQDENGKATWYLKENKEDSSYTQTILQNACRFYKSTDLVVLGGGEQALKEVYELLVEADENKFNCPGKRKINLHLVLGLDPNPVKVEEAKAKGKKKAYRASLKTALMIKDKQTQEKFKLNGEFFNHVDPKYYQIKDSKLEEIESVEDFEITTEFAKSELDKAKTILIPTEE